ncbi:hypothetical protein PVAP13_3NG169601 [Panicum virgatum]|uniref:Uncharacterized protein n=1 Tax=Panicum virgatum TaxID=38727 RepID=A0A8T0UB81_PANVG|nr:hypothetical protein PVAP13_3NG169601 [Panicum virgatum]
MLAWHRPLAAALARPPFAAPAIRRSCWSLLPYHASEQRNCASTRAPWLWTPSPPLDGSKEWTAVSEREGGHWRRPRLRGARRRRRVRRPWQAPFGGRRGRPAWGGPPGGSLVVADLPPPPPHAGLHCWRSREGEAGARTGLWCGNLPARAGEGGCRGGRPPRRGATGEGGAPGRDGGRPRVAVAGREEAAAGMKERNGIFVTERKWIFMYR